MLSVTMYKCEICKEIHENVSDAMKCEARGKENPLVNIGDMIEYEVKMGGGFDSLYVSMRVKEIEDNGHYYVYQFEEYCDEDDEWYESGYCMSGIWGNEEFNKLCKIL